MSAAKTGWFADNALSIGRTPLVRLNRATDGAPATALAKVEGRNLAYSVKCRIGAALVWDAERRGALGPGGNTGIALRSSPRPRGTQEPWANAAASRTARVSEADRNQRSNLASLYGSSTQPLLALGTGRERSI